MSNKRARGGKADWIKYFIWVPWLGTIVMAAVFAGGLYTVDPLYQTANGVSVAQPANYFVYFTIIVVIVVLAFAAGKRAFCHYGCWMAPFMVIGTKIRDRLRWASLGLKVVAQCKECKTCEKNCPMSLPVNTMVKSGSMVNTECILCGTCVDNCPNGVIRYYWRPQRTSA